MNNNMDNYMLSDTKMPIQSCSGFFEDLEINKMSFPGFHLDPK